MGDAKRKSQRGRDILIGEARCIYCDQPPDSLEHFPPKSMFRRKYRPDGMVFASCRTCNNGTSTADLIASFLCRIRIDGNVTDWQLIEGNSQLSRIARLAPDFIKEFFNPEKNSQIMSRLRGIIKPAVKIKVDGPVTKAYLSTFSSKFGMALFREHTGVPLPLDGKVFSQWFANAGLTKLTAETFLSILPEHSTLKQGKWEVSDQFGYHYNSDGKTIVVGLASFQGGLFVHTIATTLHEQIGCFTRPELSNNPTDAIVSPGGLIGMMPKNASRIIV